MITCSVCGSRNEVGALFCGTCGSPLAPAEPSPAETAPPTPAPTVVEPAPAPAPVIASIDAPEETGIRCPVCGTQNDVTREFCRKCASILHPGPPPKPPSMFNRQFWISFALSSIVGLAVVVGGAYLLRPSGPTGIPIAVAGSSGDRLDFALQPGDPKPLPKLPTDSTIQLASAKQAVATGAPEFTGRPPWWNSTVPRIPPVSQFDGGPLQRVNCVMAAGAMLARLGYGIVTTGSQLRALQDDQADATNYGDLENALTRGWGVHFFKGDLTVLQLRALLWAGAGVEIGIVYGEVSVGVRLQESFTGNHSIYIDAFRPAGPDGPAAYYVMDPIGHTWAGYRGGWWPAEDVERAAKAHSQGKVSATWAFAGGVVPKDHPILPREDYPVDTPSPSLGPTAAPTAVPADPMPSGDLALTDPPVGDPAPDTPQWIVADFQTNLYIVDPSLGLPTCAVVPAPPGCPVGIVGISDFGGVIVPTATSPPPAVQLLFANPIALGTYQIIFTAPPDTTQSLWLWSSTGGGTVQQTPVEQGFLSGSPVSISTITVDPTGNFSFVATASGAGTSSSSVVGSLVVGQ